MYVDIETLDSILGSLHSVFGILYSVLAFGLVLDLPWSRSLYPDVVAVKTLANI